MSQGPTPRDRPAPSLKEAARCVVRTLQGTGHAALFAGGCVRDMLMDRDPHDYDVATDARPEQVVALFRRTQQVGAKFGVVLVRIGPHLIEVATFRTDGDYADGRRPDSISFTDAEHDAQRRDFTINGMFHDPIEGRTIDYVGGIDDLQRRVIRAIGDPATRFAEDHLRMLRAIRFAARLDFVIEPNTWQAIRDHAAAITRISPERISMELQAILEHPGRSWAFADLCGSGLLPHLWPGVAPLLDNAKSIEALLAALLTDASFALGLAAMLHLLTPAAAEDVCRALRCSNQVTSSVRWLVEQQEAFAQPDHLMTLADLKLLMAHPCFDDLLRLFRAKLTATGRPADPYERIAWRAGDIPADAVTPPPLFDGNDLAALRLRPGPAFGEVLRRIYYAQLNNDIQTHEQAEALAQRLIRELP